MRFASNLTNAGGVIKVGQLTPNGVRAGVEYICSNSDCEFDLQHNLYRDVVFGDYIDSSGQLVSYNGRIVGAATPEPATWALGIIGLLGFAGFMRRVRAR